MEEELRKPGARGAVGVDPAAATVQRCGAAVRGYERRVASYAEDGGLQSQSPKTTVPTRKTQARPPKTDSVAMWLRKR